MWLQVELIGLHQELLEARTSMGFGLGPAQLPMTVGEAKQWEAERAVYLVDRASDSGATAAGAAVEPATLKLGELESLLAAVKALTLAWIHAWQQQRLAADLAAGPGRRPAAEWDVGAPEIKCGRPLSLGRASIGLPI